MELPEVEEQVYWQWQKAKAKAMDKGSVWESGIHVTDIVSDCLRPVVFRAMAKQKGISAMSKETNFVLWQGTMMHKTALGEAHTNEVALEMNVCGYKLKGTIDDLYSSSGELVIVDKKTHNGKLNWSRDADGKYHAVPLSHHVNQINYYNYLMASSKKQVAKWGAIIYINPSEKEESVAVFKLKPLTDVAKDVETKVKILGDALKNNKLPSRVKGWQCNYCLFFSMCLGLDE